MNAIITYPDTNATTKATTTLEELVLLLTSIHEEDSTVIIKLKLDFSESVLMTDFEGKSAFDFETTPSVLIAISQFAHGLCAAHEYRYWKYVNELPPNSVI